MTTIQKILLTGIGATVLVDIWIYILGLFNIKSLDYRYLGRWIGNFPKGKFLHSSILKAAPVDGELIIGWAAHYMIGITFSFLPYVFYGNEWIDKPGFTTALFFGLITLAAPLFIMQPAFGFGIASSKLPEPVLRIFKSFLTHLVYGTGLYITAVLVNKF